MRGARRAVADFADRSCSPCSPAAASSARADAIVVGHVASLTGDTATFGRAPTRACAWRSTRSTPRGGVLGKPVELDHRGRPLRHRRGAHGGPEAHEARPGGGADRRGRLVALARGRAEAQRAQRPDDLARLDQPEGHRGRRLHLPRLLHRPLPGRGDGAVRGRRRCSAKRVAILIDVKKDYSVGLAEFFRETVTEARRRDRRRRALHQRRHRVPRAAHHDPRGQARRDLRARLLHRVRPDRAAGARARASTCRCSAATAGTRAKTLEIGGEAVEGYYFSNHYAADVRQPAACRRSSPSYQAKYGGRRPTRWRRSATTPRSILADALAPRRLAPTARSCATRSPRPRTSPA